ncbi:MAG: cyclodeaminase/cyclohydrolase family protein, partial [Bacteroidota bacterium]|nr:cyclodeaminase/cyclohydrolase family protein [Bacteroidota bacterium]
VMQTAFQSLEVIEAMAEIGNPNSLSDAGVGALCARTAVYGAYLNVKINSGELADKIYVAEILTKAGDLLQETLDKEAVILRLIESRI